MASTTTQAASVRGQAHAAMRAALVLLGFTAVIAQVVLMRELMVVFCGNEVSLGLMLCSWLLWTAAGSFALGRQGARIPSSQQRVAALEVLLALALPLTILGVRSSKLLFHPLPGELLGPGAMLLVALLAFAPFCFLSGGMFAAGSRLYSAQAGSPVAAASSSAYLLEAAGSGAGGLLASLVLICYLTAFQIAAVLAWLNLLLAAVLGLRELRRAVLTSVALALPLFLVAANRLEEISLQRLWRGFHVVAVRNSIYGNLVVVETGAMRSLYENGVVAFHVPDPAAAEESVHFALLEHPHPRRALLIGGGLNGSVSEALKHPGLERLEYVELDPAVFDLARHYFPEPWRRVESDPRARVHHLDGRLFVKNTGEPFDVVIVNLPDPETAQLNRFYTAEFFREVAARLTPDGLVAIQLRAAENYISPELGEFLRCIRRTLGEVFAEVRVIPGDTVRLFAARRQGVLAANAAELVSRLKARKLETRYVREYYFPLRMMPDRIEELEAQMQPQPGTAVNRDFAPRAYYFDVALWSGQFNPSYSRWFRTLAQVDFTRLAVIVAMLLFLVAAPLLGPGDHRRTVAGLCVGIMGMTTMALQVLLLLGFQAIFGYVYSALAVLIAGFMIGLALGSWCSLRSQPRFPAGTRDLFRLGIVQLVAAVAPVLLLAIFQLVLKISAGTAAYLSSRMLFPALALLCGVLGGYQFPIASRVFFAGKEGRRPGALYALDLLGACLGAVLLSAYLIPVFGFFKTAVLIAIVNLVPAVLASQRRVQGI